MRTMIRRLIGMAIGAAGVLAASAPLLAIDVSYYCSYAAENVYGCAGWPVGPLACGRLLGCTDGCVPVTNPPGPSGQGGTLPRGLAFETLTFYGTCENGCPYEGACGRLLHGGWGGFDWVKVGPDPENLGPWPTVQPPGGGDPVPQEMYFLYNGPGYVVFNGVDNPLAHWEPYYEEFFPTPTRICPYGTDWYFLNDHRDLFRVPYANPMPDPNNPEGPDGTECGFAPGSFAPGHYRIRVCEDVGPVGARIHCYDKQYQFWVIDIRLPWSDGSIYAVAINSNWVDYPISVWPRWLTLESTFRVSDPVSLRVAWDPWDSTQSFVELDLLDPQRYGSIVWAPSHCRGQPDDIDPVADYDESRQDCCYAEPPTQTCVRLAIAGGPEPALVTVTLSAGPLQREAKIAVIKADICAAGHSEQTEDQGNGMLVYEHNPTLSPVSLACIPPIEGGWATLVLDPIGPGAIRVWDNPGRAGVPLLGADVLSVSWPVLEMPHTVWVEGVRGGPVLPNSCHAKLYLRYNLAGASHTDVLNVTVCQWRCWEVTDGNGNNGKEPGPDDDGEDDGTRTYDDLPPWCKPVPVNDDDDNRNGVADMLDPTETGDFDKNDLIGFRVRVYPPAAWRLEPVYTGTGQVRIWKSRTKGQGNEVLPGAWQAWQDGDEDRMLWLEATAASSAVGDIGLVLQADVNGDGTFGPGEPTDDACLTADDHDIDTDLDIDSDNDNGTGDPECDDEEEELEDGVDGEPGDGQGEGARVPSKIVYVNDDDDDRDEVTDYFDGYDNDGVAGNDDDANEAENEFVPVKLHIGGETPLDDALIWIDYPVSPPGEIWWWRWHWAPWCNGSIRLWATEGKTPRNKLSRYVDPAGDYIEPGWYFASDLLDGRDAKFWVEGILPSCTLADVWITVSVVPGPDSWLWGVFGDTVRLTVVRQPIYDLDVDSDNNDGKGLPRRDGHEEQVEQDPPGKIIVWNNDDDDGNDSPDYQDDTETDDPAGNDLIPFVITLDGAGPWRLRVEHAGDGRAKLWRSPTKGAGQQLNASNWQQREPGDGYRVYYVEGTAPSSAWGDVTLVLEVDSNEDGQFDQDDAPADRIRLTVLQVSLEVFPDEPFEISADDAAATIVALVDYVDPETGEVLPAEDGSRVEWRVISQDGTLWECESTTYAGAASTVLETSPIPGPTYRVAAVLTEMVLPGEQDPPVVGCGIAGASDTLEVMPGYPAEIWTSQSKASYHSDETDTADFQAVVFDAAGNLVADGTVVSWLLDVSTSGFLGKETSTTGGFVSATLLAPMVPYNQDVHMTAGGFAPEQPSVTMGVARVSGSLTSSTPTLDISSGQQAILTATADAADQTPVVWTTSSGSISGNAVVVGGYAGAILSSGNGRLGPVTATATIGDRLLVWEGQFVASGGLALGAEHPVLVADAPANGVETFIWPDGTVRQIPYWTSTAVTVQGPQNSQATISLPGVTTVEAYTFDQMTGNVVAGQIAGYDMTVTGAALDSNEKHAGAASLRFDGDDSGSIADAAALDFTSSMTLEMWVRPTTVGAATLAAKGSAWKLELLADGRVQATVTTSSGTFTTTTSEAVSAAAWSQVGLQVEAGVLRVFLNSHTSVNATLTGTLTVNDAPIVVGSDFEGHVDDLTLTAQVGGLSLVRLSGLDAAGRVQLDEQGRGTFYVSTRGVLPGDGLHANVAIHASVNPEDTEIIVVTKKSWYVYIYDPILSFFGGDPQTYVGTAANIAGGIVIVGDVGSEVKNLWRMAGFSSTPPNYAEMILSGLGLATEFAVGIGEIADVGISTARAIVARIGNCPLADLIAKRIAARVGLSQAISAAEQAFLSALRISDELTQVFKQLIHSDELMEACIRAHDRIGELFLTKIQAMAASVTRGAKVARQTAKVLGELSDDVIDLLKQSGRMDEVIDNLGTILKYVPNPEILKKILSNPALRGHAYSLPDLLSDIAHGDLHCFNGDISLGRLTANTPNVVKGTCFEVRSARHLKEANGKSFLATERLEGKTGFDLFDDTGCFYQCKAVQPQNYKIKEYQAWCEKAREASGASDFSKVKWVVPEGTQIPAEFLDNYLKKNGIEIFYVLFQW